MSSSRARILLNALLVCAGVACTPHADAAMERPLHSTSFLTSDGVRLHVLEACPDGAAIASGASGPVIAFIPGWSMPASIWREQLAALGASHCVAALDPRGQGESEIPEAGYSIDRRAADVQEFVARYPSVVLVGWSLGALEALEYLHLHGDAAVDALVLVDSSVGEEPPPPPGSDFISALRNDRRATLEDFVRDIFKSRRPESEIEYLTEAALRMPLEGSLSIFPRGIPRTHWRDIARAFPKPLLYVVTPQFEEQAHNLQLNRAGTRIEVFDDAGHALFADEPARFNSLIAGFVAEVSGAISPR